MRLRMATCATITRISRTTRKTALWARMEAARRDMSASRFVGDVLRRHMRDDEEYARAQRSYRRRSPVPLSGGAQPYPARDGVHAG